jgi:nucleotide-binding universal stress UspA family protein
MDTTPVVVGLDGSACGRAALRYGIAEARRLGTALELVYAPEWPYLDGALGWWSGREPGGQPLLDALATVRGSAPELVVTATVADGPAAEALIDRSATAAAVVVGAHGAAGFPALHLGATSVQVAIHATGPVVVVPARYDNPDGPVVVGVDESASAGLALWYALHAAGLRGTELEALHAWQPPQPQWPHRVQPLPASFIELQAVQHRELEVALDRWRGAFPEVPVRPRLLPGDPAATLVAASVRAGLLVVGAHGLDAPHGVVGSVARSVLERARCPVAVVHPHRHAATDAAVTGPDHAVRPKVPAER